MRAIFRRYWRLTPMTAGTASGHTAVAATGEVPASEAMRRESNQRMADFAVADVSRSGCLTR